MAKLTIKRNFGVVPNSLLNNKSISLKASGLYAFIQSKPDDWDFSAIGICSENSDGRDSIQSGLRELEKHGWLERIKTRSESGTWGIEYILHCKSLHDGKSDMVDNTESEFSIENSENQPGRIIHHGNRDGKTADGLSADGKPVNNINNSNKTILTKQLGTENSPKNSESEIQILEIQKPEFIKIEVPEGLESELTNFIAHWTETSKSGKQRWQAEKFFDPQKRWATWMRNAEKWGSQKSFSKNKHFVGTA